MASADRMLAGIYRFRTINSVDYKPLKDLTGEYTISSKETGQWISNENGEVFLEHLQVGLTNVLVKENSDYFNVLVAGARVFKGDAAEAWGRPAMLVPRYLDKEILLTLTWVGKEFQLNLMAETFIDNAEGLAKGENCVLSFGQPKCLGMEHVSSR